MMSSSSDDELYLKYESLLKPKIGLITSDSLLKMKLNKIRRTILLEGLPKEKNDINNPNGHTNMNGNMKINMNIDITPSSTPTTTPTTSDGNKNNAGKNSSNSPIDVNDFVKVGCSLRGQIWKLLLVVPKYEVPEYIELIKSPKSSFAAKIKEDTKRTLKTDTDFQEKVIEKQIKRVLNAFVIKAERGNTQERNGFRFGYVQGMNVLLAPFLFVLPEIDAFYSFDWLLRNHIPTYVQPSLDGVHYGTKLFDECLKVVDIELYNYFQSKNLETKLFSFPSIMTLCGCTPPLSEVLRVWDFLFSFGPHMVVLCTLAQVILIKDSIMKSDQPMTLLRPLPSLESEKIITKSVLLVKCLPEDLYDRLARHTYEFIS